MSVLDREKIKNKLTPAACRYIQVVRRKRAAKAEGKPDDPGDNGKQCDHGDEITCNNIRDALDRCTTRLTFPNDRHNAVQPAVHMSVHVYA